MPHYQCKKIISERGKIKNTLLTMLLTKLEKEDEI